MRVYYFKCQKQYKRKSRRFSLIIKSKQSLQSTREMTKIVYRIQSAIMLTLFGILSANNIQCFVIKFQCTFLFASKCNNTPKLLENN